MIPSPELDALMLEFSRSDIRELHIRSGDFELYLSSDVSAPTVFKTVNASRAIGAADLPETVIVQTTTKSAAPDVPVDAFIICAPNLGTFYRAPKPGAENYVEVGSVVLEGDELCLIEVMKLFTSVQSQAAGTIHSVLAEDGAMVEAGQPLFAILGN